MQHFIVCLLFFFATIGYAQVPKTTVIVRAKAKDAKFIGSSLGGAYVIIRDQVSQRILAEGKTVGSTGNTRLIMQEPHERYKSIADENTAGFTATLDIAEPTFVSVEVVSPANHKQSQIKATTELWLIPGKDILGDGIVVEIPGFIIDILQPRTHQYISLASIQDASFSIEANVVMMCGCLIEKGGLWDADEMEVKGILKKNGAFVQEVDMACTAPNLFSGDTRISATGEYEIIVYAYYKHSGNTGVDKVNFVVH